MSLPPLYSIEDYWACVEEGNDLCTFKGSLTSTTAYNPIWDQIQANTSNKDLFDRSLLHRALCIPKEYSGNLALQMRYAEDYVSKEVDHLNLTANIGYFTCIENPTLGVYDYTILCALFCYYAFVTLVSIYDKWIVRKKNNDSLIWSCSVFHNWNKIVHAKNGRDYERLKCIQGLRFILMTNNICVHTLLSFCFVYLDNPTLLEQNLTGMYRILILSISHVVQPFFLISSWLCTLQIYNRYEDSGKFTFKDVAINIVNRYFRLVPLVAFICILLSTNILTKIASTPHIYYPSKAFQDACQNNMLPTLLFMNNYYSVREMCDPVTWYLSADFQFYVMTTVLMYLLLKYKWNIAKVLAIGIISTCFVYGVIIYAHNLDMIFRVHIKVVELAQFLDSVPFTVSYSATHTSLTTPLLGMMFGYIYIKYKHRTDLHENKTLVALWYIFFYGLIICILYLSTEYFNPIITAILGPFLKPLYAFSFGVCILGMSHGIGGFSKKILESRFAEIMGNFCYGTYIAHIAFCFTRGLLSYTLYPASRLEIDIILDCICSFTTGILLSLTIEQPAAVLQKKILPQIKKKPIIIEESKDNAISENGKEKIT